MWRVYACFRAKKFSQPEPSNSLIADEELRRAFGRRDRSFIQGGLETSLSPRQLPNSGAHPRGLVAAQRARLLVFDFFAGLLFFDLAAALFVVSLATAAVLLHLVAWSFPSNAWISQNALQPWQYLK